MTFICRNVFPNPNTTNIQGAQKKKLRKITYNKTGSQNTHTIHRVKLQISFCQDSW